MRLMRRIQGRRWSLGGELGADPEYIEELEARRARHDRLTRGAPKQRFAALLKERMGGDPPADEEEAPQQGARDPLLGLDPNQDASLANRPQGRRSGRVIVKG